MLQVLYETRALVYSQTNCNFRLGTSHSVAKCVTTQQTGIQYQMKIKNDFILF